MHDLLAKNQWTETGTICWTIKEAGNRTRPEVELAWLRYDSVILIHKRVSAYSSHKIIHTITSHSGKPRQAFLFYYVKGRLLANAETISQ